MAKALNEVSKEIGKIPNQNKKVHDIVALMAGNPDLPVSVMVSEKVPLAVNSVAGNGCDWWHGSLGEARIEDVCNVCDIIGEPQTFVRSCDDDEFIFESLWEYDEFGICPKTMSEEEIKTKVKECVDGLPWEKTICIYVESPKAKLHTIY